MSINFHSATIEDMQKHGERGAIMLNIFRFSLDTLQKQGANKKHGLYWFKAPVSYLAKRFTWLTVKQINTALQKLEKSGDIIRREYDEKSYDKAYWIAMPREYYYNVKTGKDSPITPTCTSCGKVQKDVGEVPEPPVITHFTKRENAIDQKVKCPIDLLKDPNNNINKQENPPIVDNLEVTEPQTPPEPTPDNLDPKDPNFHTRYETEEQRHAEKHNARNISNTNFESPAPRQKCAAVIAAEKRQQDFEKNKDPKVEQEYLAEIKRLSGLASDKKNE